MHPTIAEAHEIYTLWKEEFAFDDGGLTDDFFKRNFTLENCYVYRDKGHLVATLCAFPHTMHMQGKDFPIMFICGVITKKQERHKGFMKKLFDIVFQAFADCPLFLLQAYHPEIYTPLDFHMMYYAYTYNYDAISKVANRVSTTLTAFDMQVLSNQFLENYDGYLLRNVAYYENYIQEVKAQKMILYGIYHQDLLQGYACLDTQTGVIEELMYNDEATYEALIAHALSLCTLVRVHRFTPRINETSSKHGALMVRLHNASAIEKILQHEIHTLEDVFQTSQKPLYHYGSW